MASPMQLTPPPDVSRGPEVLGISWTMVGIDVILVALRFFVRFSRRTVGMDDYLMLVALLFFIATIAAVNMIVNYGLGKHMYYVPPQNFEPFLKWIFILQSFCFFTLAFAKASLVLLIIRLMGPQAKWSEAIWAKRILWAHMIFFFIITILSTIFDLVACKPLKANWIPNLPGGKCWPQTVNGNWAIAISAFSAYFDFLLALFPISIIWDLRIPIKKKIGLAFLLGLGILAGIAASIKSSRSLQNHTDFTWEIAPLYLWSVTEYFLNIFCGCIPTLKPLYDYAVEGKPIIPSDGTKGRSLFSGNTLRSSRFRLRNKSKGSSSEGSQSAVFRPSDDKAITISQSYDIERASKGSTEPVSRHDVLHDGHNDWPHLIRGFYDNKIEKPRFCEESDLVGHVDIKRLRNGRSGGIFLSAYVDCPVEHKTNDFGDHIHLEVLRDTLQQIDLIHRLIIKYNDTLGLAKCAKDILPIFKSNKVACLLGVEGLHQIANSASVMRMYYSLGVRYITLTHSQNNLYADSSTAVPIHNGLSEAGREMILEMNRIGMLIDLSHTSATTAEQVLDLSRAPVAFTHSSINSLCPNSRNVTDACLEKLKLNNGIIMISFIPSLNHVEPSKASVEHVVDHIEYVGKKIGYNHIGIGTDFDGMEKSVDGLEDVSKFPNLVSVLAARGMLRENIDKIIGLNIIRVLEDVEKVGQEIISRPPLEDEVKQLWNEDIRRHVRQVYPHRD